MSRKEISEGNYKEEASDKSSKSIRSNKQEVTLVEIMFFELIMKTRWRQVETPTGSKEKRH